MYQELLGVIADPDYGDITDPTNGRDITIEFLSAEEAGRSFPKTNIRVKPNTSPVSDNKNIVESVANNQAEITEIYQELSYDELKEALEKWVSGESEEDVTQNPLVITKLLQLKKHKQRLSNQKLQVQLLSKANQMQLRKMLGRF